MRPAYNTYPMKMPGSTFLKQIDGVGSGLSWKSDERNSTNDPTGIIGPLNGSPNRLS